MAEREIPGGTSNGGSTARSLTLSVLIWAGIILALFATAGLSGYFSMKRAVRGGEVAVPPLEGKPLSEASSTLARVGLVLEKSGERSDDRFASGKILAQDPPAGVKLKRNRKVRVVVSLGMEVLQVPNLVGQPARRAQIAVQQSGLRVGGVSYSRSNEVGADRVLAQEPPPGTPRSRQGRVDLLVSKGAREKTWVMPAVEGREIGAVTRLFSEGGFRVGSVRREVTPGVAAGIVVRQYPLSGYPLREGDLVSLVVSAEAEDGG